MLGNILALLIATVFGLLGYRSRIPVGTMLGALLSVIVFNTLTGMADFPVQARAVSQALAGCFIGMSVTPHVVRSMRTLLKPVLLLCICMLGFGFAIGFILYATGHFDLPTALFSAAPGGVTDITLVAMDMGADPSQMVSMHLSRLIAIIVICPALNRLIAKKLPQKWKNPPERRGDGYSMTVEEPNPYPAESPTAWRLIHRNAVTIGIAGAGGALGFLLGIPAGVLIFSIAAVGAFNILTGRGEMSRYAHRFAQILAGTVIGQSIGADEIAALGTMLLPVVILICSYLCVSYLTAFLMHRLCGVDILTALLASTPAGAGEMSMVANELGADTPVVAILHITRLITVIAVYPQIVHLILMYST
jgi:hypothetical protein